MRSKILSFVLPLAICGCGRGNESATAPAAGAKTPAARSHYLALGDSYTCGESVAPAEKYPAQLVARLNSCGVDLGQPTIVAVTGWTTDELSAGIDRAQLHGPFELVTLLIGVNNQFRRRPLDEFRIQFTALVQRAIGFAGGKAGHVVVISIPDWGAMPFARSFDRAAIARQIDAFNRTAHEQSDRAGVRWVDVTSCCRQASTQPALQAEDGLHPSGAQYTRWVNLLLPVAVAALHGS